MRSRLHILFLFVFALTSCFHPTQPALATREDRLLVYRPAPPALLMVARDFSAIEAELPLTLPQGCSLSGLIPSPGRDALVAELACPNGPFTVLLDLKDGHLQPLVADPALDNHFLGWSGDGSFVYLRVGSMTEPRILRVDLRSLRASRVPFDPYTYHLAAAPDGRRVIYSLSRGLGFGSELWTAGSAGATPRLLLSDSSNMIAFARSSPQGDGMAFIKIPDTQVAYSVGELWWADSRGSHGRKLADADAGHGYDIAWSPDGSRLAFVSRSNPGDSRANQLADAIGSNVAVVEIAGGAVTQVTHFQLGQAGSPVWSPAGNILAFAYVLDGRMEVQIVDPAGDQPALAVFESVCCPAWIWK